ncbi:MAG: nitroreductase family protein [Candidatus Firestonebacteria bacterium]
MSTYKTILQRRTIRKFKQESVPDLLLEKLVNAARVSPTGGNKQPFEYIAVKNADLREKLFKFLRWAAYITPEGIPKENEKPAAYIVIIRNNSIGSATSGADLGAAAMSILLTAWEDGLGCCWIGSCDKKNIKKLLGVPDGREVECVIALGFRAEAPVMEENDNDVKYYKDTNGVLHVPKKSFRTVAHREQY